MTYLDYFKEICSIPHGSGNREPISNYLMGFAAEHGLESRKDAACNVVIRKAASAGREEEPVLMLQGHTDMVAVKRPEVEFDFMKDALRLREEDGYLYAEGTSLGGDNGIAVAYMLAILADDSISHPGLECVFTTDEEVGMLGAQELDMSDLKASCLINLDSEAEGSIIVSCAGGSHTILALDAGSKTMDGHKLRVKISGLTGGHSGEAIDRFRGNAILIMAALLRRVRILNSISLLTYEGGVADNAIPDACEVTFLTADPVKTCGILAHEQERLKALYGVTEPGFTLEYEDMGPCTGTGACDDSMDRLLGFLNELPDGLLALTNETDRRIRTSSNLGLMRMVDGQFRMVCLIRSAIDEEKEYLKAFDSELAEAYGIPIAFGGDYPGWPIVEDSYLTGLLQRVYYEMNGVVPGIEAVHGGLECGLFHKAKPEMEICSVGPRLQDIHSFNEKLDLASCERVWNYLLKVLEQIGR